MKIAALTLKLFVENVWAIAGHGAYVAETWPTIQQIEDLDLLMVFLHPSSDGRAWLNDDHEVVVTADQIRAATNLRGAVVFVGACYGLENDAMIEALKGAGAKAVIAGAGVNVGGIDGGLAGADIMAGALRSALQMGLPIGAAWAMARTIVHVARLRRRAGAEDALAYRLLLLWEGVRTPSQPSPVQTTAQGKGRVAAVIAGAMGLLAMLLNALSGGPSSLTFFSSILPPPAQIEVWEKTAYRNADEVDIGATIYLTDTDALTVTDRITPSEQITFTLVEDWDTAAISLTNWSVDAGSVITDSGVLTWTVTDAITGTGYGLTKTWSVDPGAWLTSVLTESLTTTETQTIALALAHGDAPTPTPTNTPTPTETPTPTITPTPTDTQTPTITPSPTPRPTFTPNPTRYVLTAVPFGTTTPAPTVLCCQVTPGATVPYYVYLPILIYDPLEFSIDPPIGGGE